jgi:RNA polymerase sigma-70 factor (ECF subfamily)
VDDESGLVDEARRGGREAFDALVVRHRAWVFNMACAMIGNASDAEDVTQDVFVRAYRGLPRFRGDSAFGTWLYRVAVNAIRTRQARRAQERTRVEELPAHEEPADGSEGAEIVLARRQAIDRALGELPVEWREAVVLRDVQGLTYQEIAAITEVPIGTVESRLFRARERLRRLLAPTVSLRRLAVVAHERT